MNLRPIYFSGLILVLLFLVGCSPPPTDSTTTVTSNLKNLSINKTYIPFTLTSSAFTTGEAIPALYTCDDIDVNPPLFINGIPEGSQSLVLIVDDPDAPNGWDPCVVFNIPVSLSLIL